MTQRTDKQRMKAYIELGVGSELIAELLDCSTRTVDAYRKTIRRNNLTHLETVNIVYDLLYTDLSTQAIADKVNRHVEMVRELAREMRAIGFRIPMRQRPPRPSNQLKKPFNGKGT